MRSTRSSAPAPAGGPRIDATRPTAKKETRERIRSLACPTVPAFSLVWAIAVLIALLVPVSILAIPVLLLWHHGRLALAAPLLEGPAGHARGHGERMATVLRGNIDDRGRHPVVADIAEGAAVARRAIPPAVAVDVPVAAVAIEVEFRLGHVIDARRGNQDDLGLGVEHVGRMRRRVAGAHAHVERHAGPGRGGQGGGARPGDRPGRNQGQDAGTPHVTLPARTSEDRGAGPPPVRSFSNPHAIRVSGKGRPDP